MAAKPVFEPSIVVNVLAPKNADAEPNAAPIDAMANCNVKKISIVTRTENYTVPRDLTYNGNGKWWPLFT
jgi:hypothetical protein